MNIFYLDKDIKACAHYHCDKHVIKMILESAQILCSVLWLNHIEAPYKFTHRHHPSVLWANESLSNWYWLKNLAGALNEEYQYRFNHSKNHRSYDVILSLRPPPIDDIGLTAVPQVLPDEFKQSSPVLAYRQYYAYKKSHFARWTKRAVPQWYLDIQDLRNS